MLIHPELILKYKKVKERYSYSKKQYMVQKNIFLTEVIKQIPQ